METNEKGAPTTPDKASFPVKEKVKEANVHPYLEWSALHAYYGPGVGIPPPYFSHAVMSGHAPQPYIWGPQPMMSPFGAPYPAIYSHGGVYPHPSLAHGSHGHGVVTSSAKSKAAVVSSLSLEAPLRRLKKRLKGSDGLAVSVSNGSADNAGGGPAHGPQSCEGGGKEGSSDASQYDSEQGDQIQRKQSSEDIPATGVSMSHSIIKGMPGGTVLSDDAASEMEFRVATGGKGKVVAPLIPPISAVMPDCDVVPAELLTQDEWELKRERRKQSNRESARRSRLRKQAESKDLAQQVKTLGAENMSLRSELSILAEKSKKLRLDNAAIMEKLKTAKNCGEGGITHGTIETEEPTIGLENFFLKLNDSSPTLENGQPKHETHEKTTSNLHQLLGSHNRTDAVAAG